MTHSYIHAYICTFFFSYCLPSCSPWETGYSSLCYTVGPHCLAILNLIVCVYHTQTPHPSHVMPPLAWDPQVKQRSLNMGFLSPCSWTWHLGGIMGLVEPLTMSSMGLALLLLSPFLRSPAGTVRPAWGLVPHGELLFGCLCLEFSVTQHDDCAVLDISTFCDCRWNRLNLWICLIFPVFS